MRTTLFYNRIGSRLYALLVATMLWLAVAPQNSFAQHVMGPLGSQSTVVLESSPADDEILPAAPADLMLRFSGYVRLMKLTLKAPGNEPVDIGFRYQPEASRVFFWNLPELPAADYYVVEWAVLDPSNLIARGSFGFSFGPDAQPASTLIPVEEVLNPVIVPDFRLIDQ
ncbi:MAG: copper resistance protein CopC [Pseudomonadota bacterium]